MKYIKVQNKEGKVFIIRKYNLALIVNPERIKEVRDEPLLLSDSEMRGVMQYKKGQGKC